MIDLKFAKASANQVRFSEDENQASMEPNSLNSRSHHRDNMLRNGLMISSSVTPELDDRVSEVCISLGVPRKAVSAFVYSSAEINADCLVDSDETCLLRFSSGLVNLMDAKEFKFVCGHELGHFLLNHGACVQTTLEDTPEGYMMSRARELSADRIGYLAIEDIDEAIQAIMKTASGLGDQYLRFDIASFLSQRNEIANSRSGERLNNTHPSMIIRCKALLWFSSAVKMFSEIKNLTPEKLSEINDRVTKDLIKYVDGQLRSKKIDISNDLVLWKSADLIFHSGNFSKHVQERLSVELGQPALSGVLSFFELHSPDELEREIASRVRDAISNINRNFPASAIAIENQAIEKAYTILGT